jgi:hypothetical protein
MHRIFFCLSLACLVSGCSFFWWSNEKNDGTITAVNEPLIDVEFVKSGRINDPARLKEGGRLLLAPFTPGPEVAASDEIDKISLRIIRGILDVYEAKWPADLADGAYAADNFDVAVVSEEEQDSQLKVHGRITEVHTSSSYKKWMLMKPKMRLSVEGWLVDVDNKRTVASFKDSVEIEADAATFADVGQEIGRHIGQFIFKKRK